MELHANSVLLVGDTHADTRWLTGQVLPRAAEQGVGAVVVVGDFGYWRDAQSFLRAARTARANFGVDVWFLDGNHEEFPYLKSDVAECRVAGDNERSPVQLGESLFYMPRGSVVEIGKLRTLVMGGAVSIDRLMRTDGVDWFMDEALDNADIHAGQQAEGIDVMLGHDAPSGWNIPGLTDPHRMSAAWRAQLPNCYEHRDRLREVFEVAQPRLYVHGHYHSGYELTTDESWGPVDVVGLGCNMTLRGMRVLRGTETGAQLDPFLADGWVKKS